MTPTDWHTIRDYILASLSADASLDGMLERDPNMPQTGLMDNVGYIRLSQKQSEPYGMTAGFSKETRYIEIGAFTRSAKDSETLAADRKLAVLAWIKDAAINDRTLGGTVDSIVINNYVPIIEVVGPSYTGYRFAVRK